MMLEKLAQEKARVEISLRVAEELEFRVWATLEISGEEYERLQSATSMAVAKLRGRYDALDDFDKQLKPNYFEEENNLRMWGSYSKYSDLVKKMAGVA